MSDTLIYGKDSQLVAYRRTDQQSPTGRSVGLIGTYPPTACGLATFTANLADAIAEPRLRWRAGVVRVVDTPQPDRAPEVVAEWRTGDRSSLERATGVLDRFDVVLLQHEFGLFGGPDGEEVLDLVARLTSPLVTVVHTALSAPSANQRRIVDELIAASAQVVVLSEAARDRLAVAHRLPTSRIAVIPHGAAPNISGPSDRPFPGPTFITWGLLGPGKGIEHGIAAVADLADRDPPPTYLVAGRTHPKVRQREGERYRHYLMERAQALGVADRVVFDDAYRDWAALRALIRGVDAVLLPYDSREQVTSGVLVEAVASGKPIVSTRFPHALEILGSGAGIVVAQGDVAAMSAGLGAILYEPEVAAELSASARRAAAPLLWPAVGVSFRTLLASVLDAAGSAEAPRGTDWTERAIVASAAPRRGPG
jgi:glycosyltransferase involved in cell wall biosynthesis